MATRSSDGRKSPTPIKVLVGRNLRAARDAAGLSQSELAREADINDAQQISKWERGVHMPEPDALIALSRTLGQELPWFYTDHGTAMKVVR